MTQEGFRYRPFCLLCSDGVVQGSFVRRPARPLCYSSKYLKANGDALWLHLDGIWYNFFEVGQKGDIGNRVLKEQFT